MPPSEVLTALAGNTAGDVAAALDAAAVPLVSHSFDPEDEPDLLVIATRRDYDREVVNLERLRFKPNRSRGTVTALSADGLVKALLLRNAGTVDEGDPVVLYADLENCKLTAILNDDVVGSETKDDAAAWRDYRIELLLRPTLEWQHWMGQQGPGSQTRFAETIELGEAEIFEPSAAVMLDLAQTFVASTGAKFKQAGRLSDGRQQFSYEEDTDAKAGADGSMAVPTEFTIAVRPFYGALHSYPVRARLRWRLQQGALTIGYQLHRPEEVQQLAFSEMVSHVMELTQAPCVEGRPPDPTKPAGP